MHFSTSQDGFISLSRNQVFKRYATLTNTLVVIPNVLVWTYERNVHGAFGLFGSNAVMLIGMAIVVLVLFWFSFRDAAARSRIVRIAFGMIVGGAIGNIVDRLHYGYVIDFIDFSLITGPMAGLVVGSPIVIFSTRAFRAWMKRS